MTRICIIIMVTLGVAMATQLPRDILSHEEMLQMLENFVEAVTQDPTQTRITTTSHSKSPIEEKGVTKECSNVDCLNLAVELKEPADDEETDDDQQEEEQSESDLFQLPSWWNWCYTTIVVGTLTLLLLVIAVMKFILRRPTQQVLDAQCSWEIPDDFYAEAVHHTAPIMVY